MQALTEIELSGLEVFSRGKVRTVYDLGDRLLIVASDRISAFDYVLPTGIPDKGRVLSSLSSFWFRKLDPVVKHHMLSDDVADFPEATKPYEEVLRDRAMLVRKAERIDIECIVRGFITGSAYREYEKSGTVAGERLPAGLAKGDKLDRPIFTPSTKADDGHDVNITVSRMREIAGGDTTDEIMEKSLAVFETAQDYAGERGIVLVDTKFEFGRIGGEIVLIDEALTPDSSRFWLGVPDETGPYPLDKQYVRDYLEDSGWDKNSPPPSLPGDVIEEARRRYILLYTTLTGDGRFE
ncbi:MAG: phosphoribosylaminoimidazolesuccinocarboxamide synthase [bacterium]|jgi:phosphoribosylaminoimidazole-succinocarboxamide synthase